MDEPTSAAALAMDAISGRLLYRRAEVIVNPTSGRGQSERAGKELLAGLRRRGVSAEMHVTRERGDALRHLRARGTDLDLVLSVGGDGTLREVLEGLVDPEIPVAVIPAGTANVLAHSLALPRDVHHALEIIFRGHRAPLDVARANGRLCFLCLSAGADAWAVHRVEERRTGPITKWAYLWPVLQSLTRYRPIELQVSIDGKLQPGHFGLVLVSNLPVYAGLLRLDAQARIDDGQLEVYLFPTATLRELAAACARGLLRRLPGGAVTMQRARRVCIEAESEAPCQVDGDAAGTTPVEIELDPTQYHLIVP